MNRSRNNPRLDSLKQAFQGHRPNTIRVYASRLETLAKRLGMADIPCSGHDILSRPKAHALESPISTTSFGNEWSVRGALMPTDFLQKIFQGMKLCEHTLCITLITGKIQSHFLLTCVARNPRWCFAGRWPRACQ